jgi:hypothetical protein
VLSVTQAPSDLAHPSHSASSPYSCRPLHLGAPPPSPPPWARKTYRLGCPLQARDSHPFEKRELMENLQKPKSNPVRIQKEALFSNCKPIWTREGKAIVSEQPGRFFVEDAAILGMVQWPSQNIHHESLDVIHNQYCCPQGDGCICLEEMLDQFTCSSSPTPESERQCDTQTKERTTPLNTMYVQVHFRPIAPRVNLPLEKIAALCPPTTRDSVTANGAQPRLADKAIAKELLRSAAGVA